MEKTIQTLPIQEVFDQFMQVPEHEIAEILDGTLYTQPRPATRHARTSSALGSKVTTPFDFGENGPGGWIILDEPELHLGDLPQILVPDLAGWQRERMPQIPDTTWLELAPDWICEVLSPSTGMRDRTIKLPIYLQEGVEWAWLIDPDQKTLEAFHAENRYWVLLGVWAENAVARIPPFDAIELPLEVLWI